MTTPFEIATQHRNEIDTRLRDAIAALNALTDDLAGDTPRVMGLTPDYVKADPKWRAAKAKADTLFQSLRQFNRVYVRKFKRELAIARRARRAVLTSSTPERGPDHAANRNHPAICRGGNRRDPFPRQ